MQKKFCLSFLFLFILVHFSSLAQVNDILIVNDNANSASAQLIKRALLDLGISVDLVSFSSHNSAIYNDYKLVIWSAGSNGAGTIFNDGNKRNALLQRALSEKKVWVEGGEVGSRYQLHPDSNFRRKVLHIRDGGWVNDATNNPLLFTIANHRIYNTPYVLTQPIIFKTPAATTDRDLLRLIPNDEGRKKVGGFTADTLQMAINTWSSSPNQATSHTLFTSFSFNAIEDSLIAKNLIQNIGMFLLTLDNTPQVLLMNPRDEEIWQAGTSQIIRWAKNKITHVKLEYKLRGEADWTLIADSVPAYQKDENGNVRIELDETGNFWGNYQWTVPTVDTSAFIRISDVESPGLYSQNSFPFYITLQPPPNWNIRKPITTPQGRLMSTYFELHDTGFVYCFGGGENAGSNLNQRFTPVTGTWEQKTPMPIKASSGGAVTVDSKIYVIGGYNNVNFTLNKVQIYRPSTDEWTEGAPMPEPVKADFGISVYNDSLIYIFGGDTGTFNGSKPVNNVRIYNPDEDTWTDATPLPIARAMCAAGIYNNTILVVGSYDRSRFMTTDTIFKGIINPSNPSEITWTHSFFPDGAIARPSAASTKLGIIFVGGDSGFSSNYRGSTFLSLFNEEGNVRKWFPLNSMPTRRTNMGTSLATNGFDSVWAIGGFANGVQLNTNEVLYIPDTLKINRTLDFTNAIPEAYHLYQNYPNPFNPITSIRFELQSSGSVTLKVYNIIGQEMITLVNNNLELGVYETKFDASQIPSGVYFYRLNVVGNNGKIYSETKKMVLLK